MHETVEERERRLRQLYEPLWDRGNYNRDTTYRIGQDLQDEVMVKWLDTNPCRDIVIDLPQIYRCTIGVNPLIKYNEYKFNFNGKR